MKRVGLVLGLIVSLLYVLMPVSAQAAVNVFVSIVPQAYFVQKIGGDQVKVEVMVPPGGNPHSYEPKPRQMAELSKAAVYFAIGINFEDVWLPKFAEANPNMTIVHLEANIEKIPMVAHQHHDDGDHDEAQHDDVDHDKKGEHHDEGDADHHDHEGRLDPHVWTSVVNVKTMARTILDALVKIDPANEKAYQAGYDGFLTELDGLDGELRDILKGKEGMKFMVFHPAWGYFAHDYGLVQVPVEIEGKEPKPAQVKELIEHAREEGVGVVFVQPQISPKSAQMIAREINGRVVPIDPLARDWGQNLKKVADEFKKAVK